MFVTQVVGQLSSVTPDGTSNNHPGLSSEGCAELTIAGHGFHTADTIVEIGIAIYHFSKIN